MDDLAPIMEAVGRILGEMETRTGERIEAMQADVERHLAERLAQLPVPEAGADGRDGNDGTNGRDGVDRVLALPRYVKAGESCEANVIAWANAGIWQSVRATSGGPADDPSGWQCLVPGVAAIEAAEDMTRRQMVIGLRMSDGTLHECRGRMPATQLPPDFAARGWGVLAGDTLRDEAGETEMLALVDGADPESPEQWRACRLRGFRGQKGPRGDTGPAGKQGPGLAGLDIARDPQSGGLAIVPRYTDPATRAEPIAVDVLIADPPGGRLAITCWAGRWDAGKSYNRGDVVSDGGGRMLISLKGGNVAALHDGRAWEAMTDAA